MNFSFLCLFPVLIAESIINGMKMRSKTKYKYKEYLQGESIIGQQQSQLNKYSYGCIYAS
jgi:hypothetical protein